MKTLEQIYLENIYTPDTEKTDFLKWSRILKRYNFKKDFNQTGGGERTLQYSKNIGNGFGIKVQIWSDNFFRASSYFTDNDGNFSRSNGYPLMFKTIEGFKRVLDRLTTLAEEPVTEEEANDFPLE